MPGLRFDSGRRTKYFIDMEIKKTRIENLVASAILERSVGTIEINGQRYDIAPPTLATLILVSEIVATFPVVDKSKIEKTDRIYSALHNAQYFRRIGEMLGVLILGAKNIMETRTRIEKRKWLFGLIRRKKKITETVNRAKELGDVLIENIRPTLAYDLIIALLQQNEISSFFAITTSLSEANIIKPTREVVND